MKAARMAAQETQAEVAVAVGIHRTHLVHIEAWPGEHHGRQVVRPGGREPEHGGVTTAALIQTTNHTRSYAPTGAAWA